MKKSVLSAMVVLLLLGVAAYAAFFVAPTDAKQGVIYRILFLHVASAWTGLTSFFICFIANLLYVLRRQPRWDWLGVSAGETGLVFTTVVLLTGPIWAHPVWGIWWTMSHICSCGRWSKSPIGGHSLVRSLAYSHSSMCLWSSVRFAGGAPSTHSQLLWAGLALFLTRRCTECFSSLGLPCSV